MQTNDSEQLQLRLRGYSPTPTRRDWENVPKPVFHELGVLNRLLDVLRNSVVVTAKEIGDGVNRPLSVSLEAGFKIGHITCERAVFKPIRFGMDISYFKKYCDMSVTPSEREVAAFALDRALGFDLVVPTAWREVVSFGQGSIQAWCECETAHDWKRAGYEYAKDVDNVWLHKLCALDYIMGNLDRHCLPTGTMIKTRRGHVPIESVVVGDEVYTHRGRWRAVLGVFPKYYQGNLMKVRTARSYESLLVTPEHVLPVATRFGARRVGGQWRSCSLTDVRWVRAGELTMDDVLLYPRPSLSNGDCGPSSVRIPVGKLLRRQNKRFPDALLVNEDLMALLGWYLAEGSISTSRVKGTKYELSVTFSFGETETAYVDEVIGLAKRYLGVAAKVRHLKALHVLQVFIHHAPFARLVAEACGCGASRKRLADWILTCRPELLRVFIDRYEKGDGAKDAYNMRLRTVSFELAHQLRDVLLKLGEFPVIRRTYAGRDKLFGERLIHQRDLWEVNYKKDALQSRNAGAYRSPDGFEAMPVKSLEQIPYTGFVFDLEVEEDRTFCTSTFVLHNSSNWMLDFRHRVYAIDNGYSFPRDDDRSHFKSTLGKCFKGQRIHPRVKIDLDGVEDQEVASALTPYGFRSGEITGVLKRIHELRTRERWDVDAGMW